MFFLQMGLKMSNGREGFVVESGGSFQASLIFTKHVFCLNTERTFTPFPVDSHFGSYSLRKVREERPFMRSYRMTRTPDMLVIYSIASSP